MLNIDQYEFIWTAYRAYGKNISELSRMTWYSRNTVKKALRGEAWGTVNEKSSRFLYWGVILGLLTSG